MRFLVPLGVAVAACSVLAEGMSLARSDPPRATATAEQSRLAAERGLGFLQQDAAKWRKEKECSTCHHGTMTVWALSEARLQGYEVAFETLLETSKWTRDRVLARIDQPRDPRPGWNMVSTPALYLAVMARAVPKRDSISGDDLRRIGKHLLRHQEADGSWSWASAPAKNRPPPFFESDEVATMLAYLALSQHAPSDDKEETALRTAREKAATWLAKTSPSDTTQAAGLRLLVQVGAGKPAKALQPAIDELLSRQNQDGGWGQLRDAPSDAYATGQMLYFLNLADVPRDREEIRRGTTFLVAHQKEDGSWPMTSRAHPGATPGKNLVPITYFGSAWATLGLMRSLPK